MNNKIKVINEEGIECNIVLLFKFTIEEYKKNYIVYTLNDDENEEIGLVLIAEVEEVNNVLTLKSIPDEETKMVTLFYDYIKDTITEKR